MGELLHCELASRQYQFELAADGNGLEVRSAEVAVDRLLIEQLRAYVGPQDFVVALGAGVGVQSILVAGATGARVLAYEPREDLARILRDNAVRNGMPSVAIVSDELAVSALSGSPTLITVLGDATRNWLEAADDIIRAHTPMICLGTADPAALETQLIWLRRVGYAPRVHLGRATGLLCAAVAEPEVEAWLLQSSGLRALAALLTQSTEAQLRSVQGTVSTLVDRLDAHALRTELLLKEQLIHSRRVDAELFGLAQIIHGGATVRSAAPANPPVSSGRMQSTSARKFRKLVRDPRAFARDSQHGVIRKLGSRLMK